MLTLYEYLDTVIDQQCKSDWFFEPRLNYLASDVMKTLEIEDPNEMDSSINRAIQACEAMHISLKRNFKKVYCFDGRNLIDDWKISSLACYLIVINCNPGYERVAKAQLYFAMNRATRK
jgi:hypothetical protein